MKGTSATVLSGKGRTKGRSKGGLCVHLLTGCTCCCQCSEYNEREHSHWDGVGHPFYPQTGPLRVGLHSDFPQHTHAFIAAVRTAARLLQMPCTPASLLNTPTGELASVLWGDALL